MDKKQKCRYGLKCHNSKCHLQHPSSWNSRQRLSQSSDKDQSEVAKDCTFGVKCWNFRCSLSHPAERNVCKEGAGCSDSECTANHPPKCKSGAKCGNPDCTFVHPPDRNACKDGANCDEFDCTWAHPPNRKGQCRHAAGCIRLSCTFLHPTERPTNCENPSSCVDFACGLLHAPERTRRCALGTNCCNSKCLRLHPVDHLLPCSLGSRCTDVNCKLVHPSERPAECRHAEKCIKYSCPFLHPGSRASPCKVGAKCANFACKLIHPSARRRPCLKGIECSDLACPLLHPVEWGSRKCPASADCVDADCRLLHPEDRPKFCPHGTACWNPDCEYLHPANWSPSLGNVKAPVPAATSVLSAPAERGSAAQRIRLRTAQERDRMRSQNSLPIFASRAEFTSRLREARVLVVTAETGSGKTTQLPQYCADDEVLGWGLIVCTQPRGLAATTIASRVADEFDGGSVGQSVGFRVGGGKEVAGRRIMLVTDAALVRMAQRDPGLSAVSVLMVDEAHERSLNTDLVLGIAKTLLQVRPTGFYVLIASATIDPKPFLDFFFDGIPGPVVIRRSLQVPGRTFEVTLEERAVGASDEREHRLRIDALVPTVLQTLAKYPEGHCLAFLPGSKEVDDAVRTFRSRAPPSVVALALYGGLPPEEQQRIMTFDDKGGALRMVVFCTNVAETSLTVPNVRLVVDTGLAKEARYDAQRRITVLEQVTVSLSSANQRKGRAGRTAPGHCVRLYSTGSDAGLRDNIEPEILRSSLDMVVLQLKQLGHDPLRFELIDRPDEALIRVSLDLLTSFGCFESDGGRITERGRVFNEMPFDPRMSNFVLMAHEQFGCGVVASEIAAILTAPGSVFFMGGSGRDARDLAKQRVATAASQHPSDLTFLRESYLTWLDAGLQGSCPACKTRGSGKGRDGCRICRVKFCVKKSLNNKVLEAVLATTQQVARVLKGLAPSTAAASTATSEDELLEGLGRSLCTSFKEQVCELLLPSDPTAGCFLLDSGEKGVLSSTSFAAWRSAVDSDAQRHMVVMSVTKVPSGMLVVDIAHPLKLDWLQVDQRAKVLATSLDVQLCFQRPNVNGRLRAQLAQVFKNLPGNAGRFIFCSHDVSASNMVRVFAPRAQVEEVHDDCERRTEEFLRAEAESDFTLRGELAAVFTGGLMLRKVELRQQAATARVMFTNPAAHDIPTLETWICKQVGIRKSDIKWCRLLSTNSELCGMASFASPEATKEALKLGRQLAGPSEEWGQTVNLKTVLSEDLLKAAFVAANLQVTPQHVELLQARANLKSEQFVVSAKNLPASANEAWLRMVLGMQCNPNKVVVHFKPQIGAATATLVFDNQQARDQAIAILSSHQWQPFTIMIPPKMKNKSVIPSFELAQMQPVVSGNNTDIFDYRLSFGSVGDAERFVRLVGVDKLLEAKSLHVQASLVVQLPELFDLDTIVDRIEDKFEVKISPQKEVAPAAAKPDRKPSKRFQVVGLSPSKCAKAAQALAQATMPMRMNASNRRQEVLYSELLRTGQLREWAHELSLMVEFQVNDEKICTGFTIFGPTSSQGGLMAKIGEYSDDFDQRFKSIMLVNAAHLRKGAVGHTDLKTDPATMAIKEAGGYVEYNSKHCGVDVYLPPSQVEKVKALMAGVEATLSELAIKYGTKVVADQHLACVYCGEVGDCQSFAVCGHSFCLPCLHDESVRLASSYQLPIRCSTCQTVVSVKDIMRSIAMEPERTSVLTSVTMSFLRNTPNHSLGVCCSPGCDQILSKDDGYTRCPGSCGNEVCILCGLVDTSDHWSSLHKGVSCATFRQAKQDAIEMERKKAEELAAAAERMRLAEEEAKRQQIERERAEAERARRLAEEEAMRQRIQREQLEWAEAQRAMRLAEEEARQQRERERIELAAAQRAMELEEEKRAAERKRQEDEKEAMRKRALGLTGHEFLDRIIMKARSFAEVNFDANVGSHSKILVNPGLARGCHALQNFCMALHNRGGQAMPQLLSMIDSAICAWHGTKSDSGIVSICDQGFDPMRRSGQVHGRGEYFGLQPSTSQGYTGNCKRLIVAVLLKVKELKTSSNFCYVMDNPLDGSMAFNLPVLVLNYDRELPDPPWLLSEPRPLPRGFSSIIEPQAPEAVAVVKAATVADSFSPATMVYSMPFRWEWFDNCQFQPYREDINTMFEQHYARYHEGKGPSSFVTQPIVRFLDDKPQTYKIDFARNLQINTATDFKRNIRRSPVQILLCPNVRWEVRDDAGSWSAVDSLVNSRLEVAFRDYSRGIGPSTLAGLQVVGRPERYTVCFIRGNQFNESSGTSRDLRRRA